MTQAVHNIDLLQWFMGEAIEVSAAHHTFVQPIEVEDTAVATIRFAGGGLATLAASTALTPGLGTRVQVTGRTGATAGLAEYPEGSEARIDLWAIPGAETVTDPFGGGLTTDLDLATIWPLPYLRTGEHGDAGFVLVRRPHGPPPRLADRLEPTDLAGLISELLHA